mmetsp:Transcript_39700/g.94253  ORF Transcript_39700/g.94253 Transcript_39700/m.94253 type:complete len:231 (+) Transcript_39700:448-1140(+)
MPDPNPEAAPARRRLADAQFGVSPALVGDVAWIGQAAPSRDAEADRPNPGEGQVDGGGGDVPPGGRHLRSTTRAHPWPHRVGAPALAWCSDAAWVFGGDGKGCCTEQGAASGCEGGMVCRHRGPRFRFLDRELEHLARQVNHSNRRGRGPLRSPPLCSCPSGCSCNCKQGIAMHRGCYAPRGGLPRHQLYCGVLQGDEARGQEPCRIGGDPCDIQPAPGCPKADEGSPCQ